MFDLKYFIILLVFMLIMPVSANTSILASPGIIYGSGDVLVTNNGDTPLIISYDKIQIMQKDGNQILAASDVGITMNPSGFTLQPGESKTVHIDVPSSIDGKLYGVRIIAKNANLVAQVTAALGLVVKIDNGGAIENVIHNLKVSKDAFPVMLSGLDVSVTTTYVNEGNIVEKVNDKYIYPNDVVKQNDIFPTGLFDIGFKDIGGVSVFIVPSWLFLIGLIGGAIVLLRRKVDIKLK